MKHMAKQKIPTAADVDTETDPHFDVIKPKSKLEQAKHDEAVARIKGSLLKLSAK